MWKKGPPPNTPDLHWWVIAENNFKEPIIVEKSKWNPCFYLLGSDETLKYKDINYYWIHPIKQPSFLPLPIE